jgi:hypothetical protein|tara:strand:+ start:183 stop:332 length:150 start_codon:yes stop_codon:yes gene_type:complete
MGLSKVKGITPSRILDELVRLRLKHITGNKIKKGFTMGKLLGGYYLNWY